PRAPEGRAGSAAGGWAGGRCGGCRGPRSPRGLRWGGPAPPGHDERWGCGVHFVAPALRARYRGARPLRRGVTSVGGYGGPFVAPMLSSRGGEAVDGVARGGDADGGAGRAVLEAERPLDRHHEL